MQPQSSALKPCKKCTFAQMSLVKSTGYDACSHCLHGFHSATLLRCRLLSPMQSVRRAASSARCMQSMAVGCNAYLKLPTARQQLLMALGVPYISVQW